MLLAISLYVLFWPDPAGAGMGPAGADKVVHALLFAGLSGSAALRFGRRWRVLLAVLLYATISEVVQALVLSRRSGDLWDLLADTVGIALGWWAAGRRRGR